MVGRQERSAETTHNTEERHAILPLSEAGASDSNRIQ